MRKRDQICYVGKVTEVLEARFLLSGSATSTQLDVTSQGDTAHLAAIVSSPEGIPGGTVSFYNAGMLAATGEVSDGVATADLAKLSAGPQQFTAVYSGSSAFAGSTSAPWNASVQAPTTVTVAASASETKRNTPYTLTAVVGTDYRSAAVPTGTMQFREGDVILGAAPVVNGIATWTTTTLSPGFHEIAAHYSGDSYFSGTISDAFSHHVIYDNVIDVLVAYTPQAAAEDSQIVNSIYAAIADANVAMINSKVEASIELVYAYQTSYRESGTMDTDLKRIATAGDGYMDEAQGLRERYGADVVALWEADSDSGGLAYVLQNLNDSNNADLAYFALLGAQGGAPTYTFAHELGHILGAAHDREHADSGGLYPNSYGYRFTVDGTVYHDIMSYDPGITIPYYANPDVLYKGVPTGNKQTSDVAGTLRVTAPVVSDYRPTRVPSSTPVQVTLSSSLPSGSNYDAFTLTAQVSPTGISAQTPMGIVTFYDGATKLGESALAGQQASWTGRIRGAGLHQLRAVYVADDFFGGGASADTYVTTFEAKVLPGGALRVTSTPGDDTILVTNTGNTQVIVGNQILNFATPTSIYIDAGAGNDIALIGDNLPAGTIMGGGGDDWLVSGNGNDLLAGKGGNDKIEAGIGNDTALGGKGNDSIYGGDGNDLLGGAGGNDLVYGQAGNDTLSGDGGQDTLKGAGGDDVLVTYDLNADVLTGGAGVDTAFFDSQLDSRQDVIEVPHPDEAYVLA